MIWWISQPNRARSERAAIGELEERSPWLSDVAWRFESDARLTADFTIRHLDEDTPLKIVYPSFFPDTPPQVVPRENIRLSGHQWGIGGELCLEYRADNWDPGVTGAMMIESAYRLLSGERPSADESAQLPSAHNLTRAQEIRGNQLRFLVGPEEAGHLRGLVPGTTVELGVLQHFRDDNVLLLLTRVGSEEEPLWSQPKRIRDGFPRKGFALRLSDDDRFPFPCDSEAIQTLLAASGAADVLDAVSSNPGESFLLLLIGPTEKAVYLLADGEQRTALQYTTVELPEYEARLPEAYARLTGKKVAIVGCGSMGSKIAASLARSGVGNFVIIDEDILFPGNLVRHDLDWGSVGMHKADAVYARILDINAGASISLRRIALGGQESAGSTDSAMQAMATCDLIVDATANPIVFNLCASVARSSRKPLVWGEVFAGGVGGLIARARPDIDPTPHAARRQILAWCRNNGVPWEGDGGDYDLNRAGLPPLIADDTHVSVIAGHVTALALDAISAEPGSRFPNPAYAIGFAAEWIFTGPFDTWPIIYSPEGTWGVEREPEAEMQLKALVDELFPDQPAVSEESGGRSES